MDDATLAELEHENFVGALAIVAANIPGAVVRRSRGVALIASGLPIALFNQVLIEGDDWSPEGVAEAVAELRQRGSPFAFNLRAGRDDGAVQTATELGLVPVSTRPWMPGMALHPVPRRADQTPNQTAAASDHDIRRVTDPAGLSDHIRAGALGFEMPEPLLQTLMGRALDAGEAVAIYAAYADDEPVASGMGVRTGQTIGVYNIATIPAARNRGLGAAMTRRVIDDGVAAGAEVAILQASEMGRPIYERLGFRTVVEYRGYTDRT